MNILDRYLFRAVATATLVTLLVLLLLEMLLTLLAELESVGQAQYDFTAALHYLLLIQPRRLYDLFPMALLVGSLLGMGALASGSELIVMRAAGLSLTRLTGAVAGTGLLLSMAVVLMGEFIAPPLEQFAREQRATAKGENLEIRGGRGFWARDGDDFIHVQAVLPGVRLAGIQVFRVNPEARLEWATHAESARYQEGRWQLAGVSRSRLEGDVVLTEYLPNRSPQRSVRRFWTYWRRVQMIYLSAICGFISTIWNGTAWMPRAMNWRCGARPSRRWPTWPCWSSPCRLSSVHNALPEPVNDC